MTKQLLRCGTSIGALIAESEYAESILDFFHKLSIARKKALETLYYLKLLDDTHFIKKTAFDRIRQETLELLKLPTSSIMTAKQKLDKKIELFVICH